MSYWYILLLAVNLYSCSIAHQMGKLQKTSLLQDSVVSTGFTGISIYEPATQRFLFSHHAQQYFTPASNVKLFTLFAALKYLGDSLPGLKYRFSDQGLRIYPSGDPTLLHPDFRQQPVMEFLQHQRKLTYYSQAYADHLGKGWSWDDYLDNYMIQRSELPLYGNQIRVFPGKSTPYTIPPKIPIDINTQMDDVNTTLKTISRSWDQNDLRINKNYWALRTKDTMVRVPMVANLESILNFFSDTLHQQIKAAYGNPAINGDQLSTIYSRPVDSMLIPMMHNSDNFFAEQSLLMASNELLGRMSTQAIIDTLLKTDLAGLPQPPTWVDGSGLSRYNLCTPESIVYIIDQLRNQIGLERLQRILPTGGQGTLKGYFLNDSNFIFAKTGTLSGTVALSGILITKQHRVLLFSILSNNFKGRATAVRRAMERFLQEIRQKY